MRGKVQVDDAYLGGDNCGGRACRGLENKIPIVAAVSVDHAGHPQHMKLATWTTFSFSPFTLAGCEEISDGLACFRAVAKVGCFHQVVVLRIEDSDELTEFRWIDELLSNMKTSFSGTFHSLSFKKYGNRYLGAFSYCFNRRFNLIAMIDRVLQTACCCLARSERLLRVA